jgi:hypothetical protein
MPTTTQQTSGANGLYVIGAVSNATANYNPGANPVNGSYTTANGGTLVMANMNGDPIAYPGLNHPLVLFPSGPGCAVHPGRRPNRCGHLVDHPDRVVDQPDGGQ